MNNSNPTIQRVNPAGVVDSSAYGFSQGVVAEATGRYVFVSGQFAGDEEGNIVSDDMVGQIKQTFKNLSSVISGCGAKPEQVVQIRVLIVNHNESYLEPLHREVTALFGEHLPASTLIPVPRLALDAMLFEIEATLFMPE